VAGFNVGDHVVSTFISMCGKCRQCVRGRPVLCENAGKAMVNLPDGTVRTTDSEGKDLNVFGACGVMAEYATLHVDNAVKIEQGCPSERRLGRLCGDDRRWRRVQHRAVGTRVPRCGIRRRRCRPERYPGLSDRRCQR